MSHAARVMGIVQSKIEQTIIRWHKRHCTTWAVRVIWILLVIVSAVQVVVAALAQ